MNRRNGLRAIRSAARGSVMPVDRRRVLGTALMALASPGAMAAPPSSAVPWPPLRLIDGTAIGADHWNGRDALVVFWATWCAYCKRHNDRLSRLHAARGEAAPRLLAVAIDGDLASVQRHVAAQSWTFPVALDDGRLRPLFTDRKSVPLTVVIGADGRVRQRIPGEMNEDDLRQLMRG